MVVPAWFTPADGVGEDADGAAGAIGTVVTVTEFDADEDA